MVLETLRYEDEVNKASGFFRSIPEGGAQPELMELATALIDKRTAKFEPGKFHDRYEDALRALIDAKRGKKPVEVEDNAPAPKASNVIDLMAALKASIEKGGGTPAPAPPEVTPRPRKTAAKALAKAAPAKPAAKAAPAAKSAPARRA